MNAPIARTESNFPVLAMTEQDALAVLESSLYPGAQLHSIKAVLSWCRANGMDPMTKPVHIVPMSVKKAGTKDYEWRDVIMPGIETYRTKAARTQAYAGIAAINYGETKKLRIDEFELEYPEWCEVIVLRLVGGEPRTFSSGRVRWLESYATAGKDTTKPNAMWKKRAFGQLEKCAEALALRRGFPESIGAELTMEELAGKTLDDGVTIDNATGEITPKIKTPAAKSTKKEESVDTEQTLSEGQKRILRARMEVAPVTDEQVVKQFGKPLDELLFSQFDTVQAWIREMAEAAA